jgi:hypothetical protein
LKYNGGRCSPNIIDLTKDGKVFDSTDIDWFLAIYEGEYDSLEKYFINFSINNESFPNSWLPIAHDSGGNLFCLEEKTGKIYFWDHERLDNKYSNHYLIAENFDEFLKLIRNE